MTIVDRVKKIAETKNAAPGQVALAWLLHKGDSIVPIPGTTKPQHLRENAAAAFIDLAEGEMEELDQLSELVAGERYNPEGMKMVNR